MTLTEAVRSGDRREALIALRDSLAEAIDGTESGRDIAALSKRLMEVMGEIAALPEKTGKKSKLEVARDKHRAMTNGGG